MYAVLTGTATAATDDDAPPRQHRLGRVLDERGDAVAGLEPEAGEGAAQPCRDIGHLRGRVLDAADVEVLGVGLALESLSEQVDDRVAFAR